VAGNLELHLLIIAEQFHIVPGDEALGDQCFSGVQIGYRATQSHPAQAGRYANIDVAHAILPFTPHNLYIITRTTRAPSVSMICLSSTSRAR